MTAYATRQDVYDLGLGAQAFASRPRAVDASRDVDIATGTIRLRAHGLSASDVVSLEVTAGGTLPTAASAFAAYAPIVVTSDLFRLSGLASFAAAGSGWAVTVDPGRRLDAIAEERSRWIDEHLTAECPPLVAPFPRQVVGLCARLTARLAVTTLQIDNAAFRSALDRIEALREADEEILKTWLGGKPVNPRPVDQTDSVENGPRAGYGRPSVGWSSGVM